MPEYHLTAKPACPPSAETRIGDFTINEVPLAIASVAAFEGGAGEAKLSEFLGFDAPGVAKWAENAGLSAFWAGPGQWFVTQAEEGSTPLVENLVDASGAELPEAGLPGQIDMGENKAGNDPEQLHGQMAIQIDRVQDGSVGKALGRWQVGAVQRVAQIEMVVVENNNTKSGQATETVDPQKTLGHP